MNGPVKQPSLDMVLEAFMASTSIPDKHSLSEWIARYPQYSQELIDLAAHWSLMLRMPIKETSAEDEDRLVLRGISAVQDILHRKQREIDRGDSLIVGLFDESKRNGMTRSQFAEATELSISMLLLLDRRLCDFDSIPTKLIEKFSQVLNRSFASIASYLNTEVTFSMLSHRKSGKSSKLAAKQDFFDAVLNDPHLREEWRTQWLALAVSRKRPRE